MKFFFELLIKSIGFSRIGRISLSKNSTSYIRTPTLVIPLTKDLVRQLNFIEVFENHDLFIIQNKKFLKKDFLHHKYRKNGFLYIHTGTLARFKEILDEKIAIFEELNIIAIIPFNIPTTSLNKEFAENEVKNYISIADDLLKKYSNLNFGLSVRIFDYYELLNLYINLIENNENIKIINLFDIFDNFSNYRKIIKSILEIKNKVDRNVVLMASGRILPKFYPILIYLGVDLINSSYLLYISSENFYDTIEYLLPIYKARYLPCSCVACRRGLNEIYENKYSAEKIDLLCLHNLISANTFVKKIKQYINYEDFRSFVEKSSFDDPNIVSMLKVLDTQNFETIRFETPTTQEKRVVNCTSPLSYNRPDFKAFRERVVKTFWPEQWTSIIVLLPCSAKKPYSESKSHKKFYRIIRKFPEFPSFQEIILTSPLGAIPRQLENVYPVNSYDIPVTGDWSSEEIAIASDMLVKLIEKYHENIPIICHLEGGYLQAAKRASNKLRNNFFYSKVQGKVTSEESLHSFETLILQNKNNFKPKDDLIEGEILSNSWIRKFVKILDYQFGTGIGSKIVSGGINTKQNRFSDNIEFFGVKSKIVLGYFNFSTGQIRLTIKGVEKLLPFSEDNNIIVYDGTEVSGNTLFRPGVIEFSSNLTPQNFVFILDNAKINIIALGKLIVGSNFLRNSKTGRIARIYERR